MYIYLIQQGREILKHQRCEHNKYKPVKKMDSIKCLQIGWLHLSQMHTYVIYSVQRKGPELNSSCVNYNEAAIQGLLPPIGTYTTHQLAGPCSLPCLVLTRLT